jgi:hypothetical protein
LEAGVWAGPEVEPAGFRVRLEAGLRFDLRAMDQCWGKGKALRGKRSRGVFIEGRV